MMHVFYSGTLHTCSAIFWSEQEWLFCRLRSGFGSEHYVTWYMGQNNSITYKIAVQMRVTVVKGRQMQNAAVSVFLGKGSVLTTERHAPESFFFFFFWLVSFLFFLISLCSPLFSPKLCSSATCILFSKIPWCCHSLRLMFSHFVSLWQTDRPEEIKTDRGQTRQTEKWNDR